MTSPKYYSRVVLELKLPTNNIDEAIKISREVTDFFADLAHDDENLPETKVIDIEVFKRPTDSEFLKNFGRCVK